MSGLRFEPLIETLSNSSSAADSLLDQITSLLPTRDDSAVSSLLSQSFSAYLRLQKWIWQCFTSRLPTISYIRLVKVAVSRNKELILNFEGVDSQSKASAVFPSSADQVDEILSRLDLCEDDNDPLISLVEMYLDNCAKFLHDNPAFERSELMNHLGEQLLRRYLMIDRYKMYLQQLRQTQVPPGILTHRFVF